MILFFARRSITLAVDSLSLLASTSRRFNFASRTLSSLPVSSDTSESPIRNKKSSSSIDWGSVVDQVNPELPRTPGPLSPEASWSRQSQNFFQRIGEPDTAYSGRSVKVENGDIASASRKISQILADNNVWKELRMAARHERKGEKRRRLRSERWRRMFKNEVRKRVELVQQIRRHGS